MGTITMQVLQLVLKMWELLQIIFFYAGYSLDIFKKSKIVSVKTVPPSDPF
ncbi:hypothetical protein [Leptospira noguchii]|uniref:Uncharacterized protein n=1 Tax=Leptospira noguchii TaxID=28182 RepID=A0AAE9GGG8_9LEPT|nr:hypothetical protein [Leptospira noguchii]UOG57507.1 hypothetical protein MAL03_05010 [Leptospira noguchii]